MAQKPGSFVHIEIASSDPQRTQKFFEDVFDWKFESVPEMEYATYMAPTAPHGGLMSPMEGHSPGLLNYLLSQSIDADVRKIEEAGGQLLQPKMEIPGVGWWALFQDPTGLILALFESRMPDLPERRRARAAARRKASKPKGKAKKGSRAGRRRR